MSNTLFLCYFHGCRGERLAVKISQHGLFRTLESKKLNGRTVIENEYFDKKFLNSWPPEYKNLKNRSEQNEVVPSHYYHDELIAHYPDATYVTIDIPKDLAQYRKALYDRFFLYTTNNTAEIIGECENRLREYNKDVSVEEIKKFTAEVLKRKVRTFGDIRCMAKGIPTTEKNKRALCDLHTPSPLSESTRDNSLVIPYEDVNDIDTDRIVDYFKKCNGSL